MSEVTRFLMSHGVAILFALVFVEQAGLPLPSAPWLLAAGALTATGRLNPLVAVGITAFACVLADSIWFYVGRRGGPRVLRLFCRLSLAQSNCVARTNGLLARYGVGTMVAAKFLPGLGAVMPPLAGALGMSAGRFLLVDSLGSLCYGGFYILVGFLFRNQLQNVIAVLNQLGFSTLLLAMVLIPGYVVVKYFRLRRTLMGTSSDKNTESRNGLGKQSEPAQSGQTDPEASGIAAEMPGSTQLNAIGSALTRASSTPVFAQARNLVAHASTLEL